MKVDPVSEEISIPSQIGPRMEDATRSHVLDDEDDDDGRKVSSAALAKANLGQQRHGAGGETGRVGCGGRPRF